MRGEVATAIGALRRSVAEQRVDLELAELLAALERRELDHEREPRDLAPQPPYQFDGAHHRASGGEQVVDDEDPLSGLDGVGVDLERGGTVLALVFDLDRLGPEL